MPGTETEFVLDYGISTARVSDTAFSTPKPRYARGKMSVLPDGRFLRQVTLRLFP